ncbi:MAG: hypothetical protein ACFHHU_11300 [Porticoccaceae bacterium]
MESDISNSLSAISVIFGIAVFHLSSATNVVNQIINKDIPAAALKLERKSDAKKAWQIILIQAMPSFLVLGAMGLIMLPKFLHYAITRDFQFWAGDFYVSLYQMLVVIVCFYFLVSVYRICCLLAKIYKLRVP